MAMEARDGSEGAVNGRRWRWCRNTKERQPRASAMLRARLGGLNQGSIVQGQLASAGRGSG